MTSGELFEAIAGGFTPVVSGNSGNPIGVEGRSLKQTSAQASVVAISQLTTDTDAVWIQ